MTKSFIPFFGEPIILWETAYNKVFYCQIAAKKLLLLPFNTTGKRHWIKVGPRLDRCLNPPSIYQGAAPSREAGVALAVLKHHKPYIFLTGMIH